MGSRRMRPHLPDGRALHRLAGRDGPCREARSGLKGQSMSNGKPPTFRDLNKNGQMDPYEDPNASVDVRVEDLLRQMTIEEKAGLMFYPIAFIDAPPGIPADEAPDALIGDKHLTHITAFGD